MQMAVRLAAAVVALVAAVLVGVAPGAYAQTPVGGYLKVPGAAGCDGDEEICRTPYPRFQGMSAEAASPDGRTIYVVATSGSRAGLIVPARRGGRGRLSFPGLGCEKGALGCVRLEPDGLVQAIRISADGRFLYALTRRRLLTIRVGEDGALAAPEAAMTLSPASSFNELALSPSGRHLYVVLASGDPEDAGGVVGFEVDPQAGTATRLPAPGGCARSAEAAAVSDLADCQVARPIGRPHVATVSADGLWLYVGSTQIEGGLAIFGLDAGTGALRQSPGPEGCMSLEAAGCTRMRGPSYVSALATAGPLLYAGGYTFGEDDTFATVAALRETAAGLEQLDGPGSCAWTRPGRACMSAPSLGFDLGGVVVIGERLLAASESLTVLHRGSRGELARTSDPAECVNRRRPCFPLTRYPFESVLPAPGAPNVLYANTSSAILRLVEAERPARGGVGPRVLFTDLDGSGVWRVRPAGRGLEALGVSRACRYESFGEVAASRNGRFAYTRNLGCRRHPNGIVVARVGGAERLVVRAPGDVEADHPSLDRAGRLLAYHRERRIHERVEVLDLRSGRRRVVARGARSPEFGPHGQIAVERATINPAEELGVSPGPGAQGWDIVDLAGRRRPLTREPRCRSSVRGLRGCDVDDHHMSWTPRGDLLFLRDRVLYKTDCDEDCGSRITSTWLMRVRPGAPPRRVRRLRTDVAAIAVSPNGRALAFQRFRTIWVQRVSGGPPRAIADGFEPVWMPARARRG
jgi:WD40-like Beta Propeller Repeat